MHSCITTLLFATLSSALHIFGSREPMLASRSSPAPVPTCLDRYTNYYAAPYNYVFFSHPAEPHFNLTIATRFLAFYPATLAAWLEEKGFDIINTSSLTDADLCGWSYGGRVEVDGRRHGQFGWKRTPTGPHGNASVKSVSHIPHDVSLRPRSATLETIRTILRDNTPYADIYYFRSLMLDMACGILGFALVYCGVVGCVENRRKSKLLHAVRDAEHIELDQIKVHHLSGAGMQRLHAGDDSGPAFTIEITKPTAAQLGTASASSSVADPPPVYSFDGIGR